MQVRIISRSEKGTKAEIVVNNNGQFVTRHVKLGEDGKYHWNGHDNGQAVKESYTL